MDKPEDKRGEPRIPHDIRFFVHVHECKEDPDMVGVSIACEAIDFSKRGLQLKTDTKLIPHSLLNVTIGLGDPFAMYLLRGEVRWVRGDAPEVFIGVLLEDVEGTDYEKWESDFQGILNT